MLCLRHHVPIYLSHYPDDWENAGSDENGEKLLMSNRGISVSRCEDDGTGAH